MSDQYDAIIIGSGPGGEGAAMKLVKAGKSVAMIERHEEVGGGCTHWGTIPSKALRQAITSTTSLLKNPTFREMGIHATPTLEQLKRGQEIVVQGTLANPTLNGSVLATDLNKCELIAIENSDHQLVAVKGRLIRR